MLKVDSPTGQEINDEVVSVVVVVVVIMRGRNKVG